MYSNGMKMLHCFKAKINISPDFVSEYWSSLHEMHILPPPSRHCLTSHSLAYCLRGAAKDVKWNVFAFLWLKSMNDRDCWTPHFAFKPEPLAEDHAKTAFPRSDAPPTSSVSRNITVEIFIRRTNERLVNGWLSQTSSYSLRQGGCVRRFLGQGVR